MINWYCLFLGKSRSIGINTGFHLDVDIGSITVPLSFQVTGMIPTFPNKSAEHVKVTTEPSVRFPSLLNSVISMLLSTK